MSCLRVGLFILRGDHGAKTAAQRRSRRQDGPKVLICTQEASFSKQLIDLLEVVRRADSTSNMESVK